MFVEQFLSDNSSTVENTYASDDVVNRFIDEFNKYSDFEMSNIAKGNIRTKFSLIGIISSFFRIQTIHFSTYILIDLCIVYVLIIFCPDSIHNKI